VRTELLPKIAGWTPNQQQKQDSSVMAIRAGAWSDINCDSVYYYGTERHESAKPIWQGVVHDCAMVLGTNAMVEYAVQAEGTTMQPFSPAKRRCGQSEKGVFEADGLPATRTGTASKGEGNPTENNPRDIGVVVPTEEVLAGKFCDFKEHLWRG